MDETKSKTLQVRITPTLHERITQACHLERREFSDMVRILLEDALRQRQENTDERTN